VTAHPSAEWIARQLTEAYAWAQAPQYIIRDRDGVYGDLLIRRLRAMGIRDRPITPRSPWQNGHTERLIGAGSGPLAAAPPPVSARRPRSSQIEIGSGRPGPKLGPDSAPPPRARGIAKRMVNEAGRLRHQPIATSTPYLTVWVVSAPRARESCREELSGLLRDSIGVADRAELALHGQCQPDREPYQTDR
jgi:hypothetical protein